MEPTQAEYTILLSKNTFERIGDYAAHLRGGGQSGEYLAQSLKSKTIEALNARALLSALLNRKKPQIFAESAVMGDVRYHNIWINDELIMRTLIILNYQGFSSPIILPISI